MTLRHLRMLEYGWHASDAPTRLQMRFMARRAGGEAQVACTFVEYYARIEECWHCWLADFWKGDHEDPRRRMQRLGTEGTAHLSGDPWHEAILFESLQSLLTMDPVALHHSSLLRSLTSLSTRFLKPHV